MTFWLLIAAAARAQGPAEPLAEPLEEPFGEVDGRTVRARWAALAEVPDWCLHPGRLDRHDAAWCASVPAGCEGLTEACAKDADRVAPQRAASPIADLSGCASGGGYMILGLVLGLMALAVTSWFFGPKDTSEPARDNDPTVTTRPGLPARLARSEDQLLSAARIAVENGHFGEALLFVRAAIVRALERSGTLPVDPGRTDRETVRALSDQPELAAAVKIVAGALERQRYAALPVDRRTMDSALDAGLRVLARVGFLVVVLGVAVAEAGPADQDRLVDWLAQNDWDVVEATEFPQGNGVVIWMPGPWPDANGAARARLSAESGNTVIVVGDAETMALFGEDLGEWAHATGPVRFVSPDLVDMAPVTVPAAWKAGVVSELAFLVDGEGASVGVDIPVGELDGKLLLVGLPNLLDDGALVSAPNARTVGEILDHTGWEQAVTVVRLDDTAVNPLRLLLLAGLGPALAQLFALWAVWAWARGRPFAVPVPAPDHAQRDFRAHLDAVAALYRGVGASQAGLAAVSGRVLHLLRERTRADDAGLAAAVAERTGEPPHLVAELLARARAAMEPNAPPSAGDLDLQEELWKLVERTRRSGTSTSRRLPRASRR